MDPGIRFQGNNPLLLEPTSKVKGAGDDEEKDEDEDEDEAGRG